MEMYSSANDSYPMGIVARFIPNVQDSRFINTLQSRTSAEWAADKYDHFFELTMTAKNYDIIGLDAEVNRISLREAIMKIQSVADPSYSLFAGVDSQPWSRVVTLIFR